MPWCGLLGVRAWHRSSRPRSQPQHQTFNCNYQQLPNLEPNASAFVSQDDDYGRASFQAPPLHHNVFPLHLAASAALQQEPRHAHDPTDLQVPVVSFDDLIDSVPECPTPPANPSLGPKLSVLFADRASNPCPSAELFDTVVNPPTEHSSRTDACDIVYDQATGRSYRNSAEPGPGACVSSSGQHDPPSLPPLDPRLEFSSACDRHPQVAGQCANGVVSFSCESSKVAKPSTARSRDLFKMPSAAVLAGSKWKALLRRKDLVDGKLDSSALSGKSSFLAQNPSQPHNFDSSCPGFDQAGEQRQQRIESTSYCLSQPPHAASSNFCRPGRSSAGPSNLGVRSFGVFSSRNTQLKNPREKHDVLANVAACGSRSTKCKSFCELPACNVVVESEVPGNTRSFSDVPSACLRTRPQGNYIVPEDLSTSVDELESGAITATSPLVQDSVVLAGPRCVNGNPARELDKSSSLELDVPLSLELDDDEPETCATFRDWREGNSQTFKRRVERPPRKISAIGRQQCLMQEQWSDIVNESNKGVRSYDRQIYDRSSHYWKYVKGREASSSPWELGAHCASQTRRLSEVDAMTTAPGNGCAELHDSFSPSRERRLYLTHSDDECVHYEDGRSASESFGSDNEEPHANWAGPVKAAYAVFPDTAPAKSQLSEHVAVPAISSGIDQAGPMGGVRGDSSEHGAARMNTAERDGMDLRFCPTLEGETRAECRSDSIARVEKENPQQRQPGLLDAKGVGDIFDPSSDERDVSSLSILTNTAESDGGLNIPTTPPSGHPSSSLVTLESNVGSSAVVLS